MMGYYVNNSSLIMDIQVFPFKWSVTRTHSHFESLRDLLVAKFPQTIVPGLPRYNYKKQLSSTHYTKRALYYERFLTGILQSMTLRTSDIVIDFLREKQGASFEGRAQAAFEQKKPKVIDELSTLNGDIDI